MIFIFLSSSFRLRMNIFPLRPHSTSSLNVSARKRNQISVAVLADSESDYELLVCSGLFTAAVQNTTQAAVVSRSPAPVPHKSNSGADFHQTLAVRATQTSLSVSRHE